MSDEYEGNKRREMRWEQMRGTPFVTVGNTGSHQPQLQQSILREQYTIELENRLRALWDKYDGERTHYMERIKRLEEVGDEMLNWLTDDGISMENLRLIANAWRKSKEAKP